MAGDVRRARGRAVVRKGRREQIRDGGLRDLQKKKLDSQEERHDRNRENLSG